MKSLILEMIASLHEHQHSREELMKQCVEDRLTSSFNNYSHELQQSILFLTRRHEKSLLKRLNKLNGKDN